MLRSPVSPESPEDRDRKHGARAFARIHNYEAGLEVAAHQHREKSDLDPVVVLNSPDTPVYDGHGRWREAPQVIDTTAPQAMGDAALEPRTPSVDRSATVTSRERERERDGDGEVVEKGEGEGGAKKKDRKVYGVGVKVFWLIVVLIVLLIAAIVGGAVGGVMARKSTTSSSYVSHPFSQNETPPSHALQLQPLHLPIPHHHHHHPLSHPNRFLLPLPCHPIPPRPLPLPNLRGAKHERLHPTLRRTRTLPPRLPHKILRLDHRQRRRPPRPHAPPPLLRRVLQKLQAPGLARGVQHAAGGDEPELRCDGQFHHHRLRFGVSGAGLQGEGVRRGGCDEDGGDGGDCGDAGDGESGAGAYGWGDVEWERGWERVGGGDGEGGDEDGVEGAGDGGVGVSFEGEIEYGDEDAEWMMCFL